MELAITLKGVEKLPDYLEQEIRKKIGKLEKYFDNMQQGNVVINKIRGIYEMEVTLFAAQRIIRAVGKGNLIDEALDDVVDKLETQVKKFSKRLKEKGRVKKEEIYMETTSKEEEELEEDLPKLTRIKTFSVKPMSIDEAILQIELLGHDFFIFRDEETHEINVLYRRKDGNYGLIKPQ
ncbi:MAG: ribosome-associated translation inhibitor RaiA [Candidatus Atribacteria bacterium]|nr:ribosome-associated translation inhibitor RaiA [Candidatus Atribacteria bacterium]